MCVFFLRSLPSIIPFSLKTKKEQNRTEKKINESAERKSVEKRTSERKNCSRTVRRNERKVLTLDIERNPFEKRNDGSIVGNMAGKSGFQIES